jgi:hypothetical protein
MIHFFTFLVVLLIESLVIGDNKLDIKNIFLRKINGFLVEKF